MKGVESPSTRHQSTWSWIDVTLDDGRCEVVGEAGIEVWPFPFNPVGTNLLIVTMTVALVKVRSFSSMVASRRCFPRTLTCNRQHVFTTSSRTVPSVIGRNIYQNHPDNNSKMIDEPKKSLLFFLIKVFLAKM
jgi:hypothetical protein